MHSNLNYELKQAVINIFVICKPPGNQKAKSIEDIQKIMKEVSKYISKKSCQAIKEETRKEQRNYTTARNRSTKKQ